MGNRSRALESVAHGFKADVGSPLIFPRLKSLLPSINEIWEVEEGVEWGLWTGTSSHLHWSLRNSDVFSQTVKV